MSSSCFLGLPITPPLPSHKPPPKPLLTITAKRNLLSNHQKKKNVPRPYGPNPLPWKASPKKLEDVVKKFWKCDSEKARRGKFNKYAANADYSGRVFQDENLVPNMPKNMETWVKFEVDKDGRVLMEAYSMSHTLRGYLRVLREELEGHSLEKCLPCSLKLLEIIGLLRLSAQEHNVMTFVFQFIWQKLETAEKHKMESPGDHSI